MFSDHFTHYAQTAFTNRLPLLGKIGEAVAKRLSACPDGIRELLQFYYGFMPLSDAFTYDFDLSSMTKGTGSPLEAVCLSTSAYSTPHKMPNR